MNTFVDTFLGGLGLAANVAGVPGLGVAANVLQAIKANCDRVSAHKDDCRQLAKKAAELYNTLEENRKKLNGIELRKCTDEIEDILRIVYKRTSEWARWSRVYIFFHEEKLAEGIKNSLSEIDTALHKFNINALIIANYHVEEILSIVQHQDARLRDLSVKILSNPDDVTQLAAAEDQGQNIARPIIEQGQLQLRELRGLSKADGVADQYRNIERGLSQLYSLTKIPPTVTRLDGMIVRSGDFPVDGGTYSDVWLGFWLGNQKVALKAMRGISASADKARLSFERELSVWTNLNHPRILPFLGIVTDIGPFICLVSPWQQNGNVRKYFAQNPDVNRHRLISQASDGLHYLHAMKVIHGNVKGSNILVSEHGQAVICDFGMSKVVESATDQAASATLTKSRSIRWLAPELLQPEGTTITPACDVYSFSMTILECLTLADPFSNVKRDIHVVTQLLKGALPTKPDFSVIATQVKEGGGEDMWKLMQSCWSLTPNHRPTMKVVSEKLHELTANPPSRSSTLPS